MKKYFKSDIGFFRVIAFLEGISLIILLLIAMPLKYLYDQPEMVSIVGSAHGLLFMLFIYFAFRMGIAYEWSFLKTALVMLSSTIPFATFVLDHKILKPLDKLQHDTDIN